MTYITDRGNCTYTEMISGQKKKDYKCYDNPERCHRGSIRGSLLTPIETTSTHPIQYVAIYHDHNHRMQNNKKGI